jgi:hypothetical protein
VIVRFPLMAFGKSTSDFDKNHGGWIKGNEPSISHNDAMGPPIHI